MIPLSPRPYSRMTDHEHHYTSTQSMCVMSRLDVDDGCESVLDLLDNHVVVHT